MLVGRPGLTIAVTFMAGALLARFYPRSYEYAWLVFAVAAAVAASLVFFKAKIPEAPPLPDGYDRHILARPGWLAARGLGVFMAAAALSAFGLGMTRQASWEQRLDAARLSLPEKYYFDAVLLALTPSKQHDEQEGGWKIDALLLVADGKSVSIPVRVSGGRGGEFRRGDLLETRLRKGWNQPSAFPGAFDYFLWLERSGLAESLTVARPRKENEKPGQEPYRVARIDSPGLFVSLRRGLDAVRSRAVSLTLKYGGEKTGPMLAAMIYGYRDEMDPEMRDSFRRVGIGHVLAISGLHVGLVVGLLWWCSGWLPLGPRARICACLVLALAYLGLSGGQVAAARATVMAATYLLGRLWGRKSDMLNSLGLAALVICAVNPSAPVDISFQLSFTAVVFIHIGIGRNVPDETPVRRNKALPGGGRFRRLFERLRPFAVRLRREIVQLSLLSVATWFGLFPIVMTVFHQVNPIGLVANLPAIPLMSLVLAGGLLLPLFGWVPGAEHLLTLPGSLLVRMARFADAVPLSSFPAHSPAPAWLVVFYSLFFVYLPLRRIRKARTRRLAVSLLFAAVAATSVLMAASARSLPPPEKGRIAALPGRFMGVTSVEDAAGNIALIGNLGREGLREANWLHYLKRGRPAHVFAFSSRKKAADYPALLYHNGIAAFHSLARAPAPASPAFPSGRWLPLPGLLDTEIAVSRDRRGRIVWLAVRVPAGVFCVTDRLSASQLDWRLRKKIPGVGADLLIFSLGRGEKNRLPVSGGGIVVRYGGGADGEGVLDRDDFGAMVLDADGVRGYNGREWAVLK